MSDETTTAEDTAAARCPVMSHAHTATGSSANQRPRSRARSAAVGYRSSAACAIAVAPIEYVLLRKLQYWLDSGSERHERDIRMMLALSGEQVDHEALGQWLDRLGLRAAFEPFRAGS